MPFSVYALASKQCASPQRDAPRETQSDQAATPSVQAPRPLHPSDSAMDSFRGHAFGVESGLVCGDSPATLRQPAKPGRSKRVVPVIADRTGQRLGSEGAGWGWRARSCIIRLHVSLSRYKRPPCPSQHAPGLRIKDDPRGAEATIKDDARGAEATDGLRVALATRGRRGPAPGVLL